MIIARANKIRKRIPFACWLAYDAVVLPFMVWGATSLSVAFALPLAMLTFAAIFDGTEAIVKWQLRGTDARKLMLKEQRRRSDVEFLRHEQAEINRRIDEAAQEFREQHGREPGPEDSEWLDNVVASL